MNGTVPTRSNLSWAAMRLQAALKEKRFGEPFGLQQIELRLREQTPEDIGCPSRPLVKTDRTSRSGLIASSTVKLLSTGLGSDREAKEN